MEIELDTSGIQQTTTTQPSTWRAPRHVYFGKKGPDGMVEDEPIYVYQEFPRMMYKLIGEKLTACIVDNEQDMQKRSSDEWVTSPALLGILTAPSFEQIKDMEEFARKKLDPVGIEPVATAPVSATQSKRKESL